MKLLILVIAAVCIADSCACVGDFCFPGTCCDMAVCSPLGVGAPGICIPKPVKETAAIQAIAGQKQRIDAELQNEIRNKFDLSKLTEEILIEKREKNAKVSIQQLGISRREIKLWKNKEVPYKISPDLGSNAKKIIEDVLATIEKKSCIKFVQRTNQHPDYVEFVRGLGCKSFTGREGGRQEITIAEICEKKGLITHEVLHALGRIHEHNRLDRDNYVKILWDNISHPFWSQFQQAQTNTYGIPYDYFSIMHYPLEAFSRNGFPTMEALMLPKDKQKLIGQLKEMSDSDIQHLNKAYCS